MGGSRRSNSVVWGTIASAVLKNHTHTRKTHMQKHTPACPLHSMTLRAAGQSEFPQCLGNAATVIQRKPGRCDAAAFCEGRRRAALASPPCCFCKWQNVSMLMAPGSHVIPLPSRTRRGIEERYKGASPVWASRNGEERYHPYEADGLLK